MDAFPRGRKGPLPRLEEVEALLDFADRPFVDGLLTSFSLHGLWRCSASPSEYGHWAKSALNRVGFELGYHFMQAPSDRARRSVGDVQHAAGSRSEPADRR